MHGLIDTTEMYLKAVFELEEDGVVPLRARIAERLNHSAPTVSQTVSRLERDGLLAVHGDRHLEFTPRGRRYAVQVMRKHRLAEVLLYQVIGLSWAQIHVEACRWEHVMSEDVERRIAIVCDRPRYCPHGNPIPGLDELGVPGRMPVPSERSSSAAAAAGGIDVVVTRISERVQDDVGFMAELHEAGIGRGSRVRLSPNRNGTMNVQAGERHLLLDRHQADSLFVGARIPAPAWPEGEPAQLTPSG
ncbi:metal-dependent transcriptional regulator [Amycolatopsis anabasis]|uniref:metal-dependent transcriptional regulator n=1 Tax=Amycolatopsis anabasis TaxID=1840409 RepID=UPI00131D9652|nr:metal-dependent transcriptional regulator [Amycolatopsis anabasis]